MLVHNLLKKVVLAYFCLFSTLTFANEGAASGGNTANVQAQVDVSKYRYCPEKSTLVRDGANGKWSAPGGWYSQSYSFAKKITGYVGAVYIGSEIGRIDCYYVSTDTGDDRIIIKNTTLAQLPSVESWQVSAKDRNVKTCKANASSGCPFIIYEEEGKISDIKKAILTIPKS